MMEPVAMNIPRTRQKIPILILCFALSTLLFPTLFMLSHFTSKSKDLSAISVPQNSIKNVCTQTPYPSLCFNTISHLPNSNTTFHVVLETSILETDRSLNNAALHLSRFLNSLLLTSQENSAVDECLVLADHTLHELDESLYYLRRTLPSYSNDTFYSLYGVLRNPLGRSLTNLDNCVNGVFELGDDNDQRMTLKEHVQDLIAPVTRMIKNCLSIITSIENLGDHSQMVDMKIRKSLSWMTRNHRFLRDKYFRPNVFFADDGSDDYDAIGEAIRMAPNLSTTQLMIKIKPGMYNETVEIYREKVNIMFKGEGMSRTIIIGSRSFSDGFSTINEAMPRARDFTKLDTSGPYKHQAIAPRLISNPEFCRCNFNSYQDTVFAPSLNQFYNDCTIKGTVHFISGNAEAVLQNCLILVRNPIPGRRNVINAKGREDPNQNTGILVLECSIMAAPEFTVADRRRIASFLKKLYNNNSDETLHEGLDKLTRVVYVEPIQ